MKERMITWMVYGRIQEHKKKGFNKSQTSRMLAIDYKTILKYWDMKPEEFTAKVEYSSTRIKKAEVYEEFVVSALKEYPDISAAQLYDWIKEKYETDNLAFKERTFRNFVDDKEKALGKILNGTKTMIVRGAAGRKIPHSRVFPG